MSHEVFPYSLPLTEAQKQAIHRRARREQGKVIAALFRALTARLAPAGKSADLPVSSAGRPGYAA
jgi:hypothetical protein